MILRGIGLPLSSLRKPVSIGCDTSVLIWMISPFFAVSGIRSLGLSAMVFLFSAAATADGHLDHAAVHIKLAGRRPGENDDVLGRIKPDPGRHFGAARHRRQMEFDDARKRIAVGDDADFANIIVGLHRAIDLDRQRYGVAVL